MSNEYFSWNYSTHHIAKLPQNLDFVGEVKKFSFYTYEFLAETLVIKDREKHKRKKQTEVY